MKKLLFREYYYFRRRILILKARIGKLNSSDNYFLKDIRTYIIFFIWRLTFRFAFLFISVNGAVSLRDIGDQYLILGKLNSRS
jgi:hypothetical protein